MPSASLGEAAFTERMLVGELGVVFRNSPRMLRCREWDCRNQQVVTQRPKRQRKERPRWCCPVRGLNQQRDATTPQPGWTRAKPARK